MTSERIDRLSKGQTVQYGDDTVKVHQVRRGVGGEYTILGVRDGSKIEISAHLTWGPRNEDNPDAWFPVVN